MSNLLEDIQHLSTLARQRGAEPYRAKDLGPRTIAEATKPREPGYVEFVASATQNQKSKLERIAYLIENTIARINNTPEITQAETVAHISASIQETQRGLVENNDYLDQIIDRFETLDRLL